MSFLLIAGREAMNLLMRWLDRYGPERPIAILERYVIQANDREFTRQAEHLVHLLYREAQKQAWRGKGLYYSSGIPADFNLKPRDIVVFTKYSDRNPHSTHCCILLNHSKLLKINKLKFFYDLGILFAT